MSSAPALAGGLFAARTTGVTIGGPANPFGVGVGSGDATHGGNDQYGSPGLPYGRTFVPAAPRAPAAAARAATGYRLNSDALAGEGLTYQYQVPHPEQENAAGPPQPAAIRQPAPGSAPMELTAEAVRILAETVPAEYQMDPNFLWAISEVARAAEERVTAGQRLPDHQTAAVTQQTVASADQLPPFHTYLLWRDDGRYTPLVPADLLPPIRGIPATQSDKVGSWVCPPPNGPSPAGWIYQQPIEFVVSWEGILP
jgi:hypothetical protein